MRRLVCVIGALAVTAGAAGASTVPCGLRGSVYVMPGGACLDDCSRKPLAEATLLFSAPGRATIKTGTRRDGTYRVRLAPGMYNVRLAGEPAVRLSPARASVVRAKYRTVRFVLANPRIQ